MAGLSLHPAAKYCDEFVSDIYDDWYLPSSDELNLAWVNRGCYCRGFKFNIRKLLVVDADHWRRRVDAELWQWLQGRRRLQELRLSRASSSQSKIDLI